MTISLGLYSEASLASLRNAAASACNVAVVVVPPKTPRLMASNLPPSGVPLSPPDLARDTHDNNHPCSLRRLEWCRSPPAPPWCAATPGSANSASAERALLCVMSAPYPSRGAKYGTSELAALWPMPRVPGGCGTCGGTWPDGMTVDGVAAVRRRVAHVSRAVSRAARLWAHSRPAGGGTKGG